MSMVACLNFGGELHLYGTGFREGADTLLAVLREQEHSQDMLVYPLVYCLRHAVELSLKQVIRAARRYLDEFPGDFPDGHNLSNLWNTCKPLLRKIWPDDPAFRTVEAAVNALRRLDPEG